MIKEYRGVLRIAGKEYLCEDIDGARFVDGLPVEDFVLSLTPFQLSILREMGNIFNAEMEKGITPDRERFQGIMDEIHQKRNN